MIRIIVRVVIAVALIAAGLGAGLTYGHFQLQNEQKASQLKINEVNRKMAALQKKAAEERDARSSVEGKKRGLETEIEALKKDNGELLEKTGKLETEVQSSQAKLKEASDSYAHMKTARDEIASQLAQVMQAARELETINKHLATGKQTLEALLTRVSQDLDSCRTHNATLCGIAEEILNRQQSTGVVGNILRNEPLTQIKRVEFEKLTKEYKDKVDQEKIKKR